MALAGRVQGWPIPPNADDRTVHPESVRATRQSAPTLMATALWREEGRIGSCGHWKLTLSTWQPVADWVTEGLGCERLIPSGQCQGKLALLPGCPQRGLFIVSALAPLLPSLFSLACGFAAEMYYFSKHPKWSNFLPSQGIQRHTKRSGLLLGEEAGSQGCPRRGTGCPRLI